MAELAILVPVLRRPQNVAPLLTSIRETTPSACVLFICDPDDEAEIAAIETEGGEFISPGGNYASKINAGVKVTSEPLLFLGADDLHFHPGWFKAARNRIEGKVGVVATNDLCNPRTMAGNLATHPLVTRAYVERYGTIDERDKVLHEGYEHEFCDQELTETAKRRGAFAYAPDAIVEHLHPDVGKAPMDGLYAGQARRMVTGRKLYRRRRLLWTRR